MHRSLAVVLCILITCASSVAQFGISDCKSGTFHGCSSAITNFPDPTGARVSFDYTSCQSSGGAHRTVTAYDTSCIGYWFDCLSNGYEKTICNDCLQNTIIATYLCNAC